LLPFRANPSSEGVARKAERALFRVRLARKGTVENRLQEEYVRRLVEVQGMVLGKCASTEPRRVMPEPTGTGCAVCHVISEPFL
jgi:hypothetical protein